MFYFCFDIYHFVKGIFGIEKLVVTINHSRKVIAPEASKVSILHAIRFIDNLNV